MRGVSLSGNIKCMIDCNIKCMIDLIVRHSVMYNGV